MYIYVHTYMYIHKLWSAFIISLFNSFSSDFGYNYSCIFLCWKCFVLESVKCNLFLNGENVVAYKGL